MGIADWVSKKLLSDSARSGGASAAALKKQEAEDAKAKTAAAEEAEAEKARKEVKEIRFKSGGAVDSRKALRSPQYNRGNSVNKSTKFKW